MAFEHVQGTTYRLRGLGLSTWQKGTYTLTIRADAFTDLGGNQGDDSTKTISWTVV